MRSRLLTMLPAVLLLASSAGAQTGDWETDSILNGGTGDYQTDSVLRGGTGDYQTDSILQGGTGNPRIDSVLRGGTGDLETDSILRGGTGRYSTDSVTGRGGTPLPNRSFNPVAPFPYGDETTHNPVAPFPYGDETTQSAPVDPEKLRATKQREAPRDTLRKAVPLCAGEVQPQPGSVFDAFVRSDGSIKMYGTKRQYFEFEKCLARFGVRFATP